MYPLIVQTGSVPALIYLLERFVTTRPVRLLALDSENVRQYLRGREDVQLRLFRNSRDAEVTMEDCKDASAVYYIGGSAFPFVQRKIRRVFSTATAVFPEQHDDWPAFLSHFNAQLRRDAVVLVQSESAELIEEYLREIFPQHQFTRPSLSLLCPQKELPYWQRMHSDWQFWTYLSSRELAGLIPDLRRQHFDACIVFFTGNPDFSKAKLLALICGARQKIAVNEYRRFIELSPASLLRFAFQRWRYGVVPRAAALYEEGIGATRVLVVQTWDEERMRRIFSRLQEGSFFRRPQYYLLTREDRTVAFNNLPQISRILTYPANAGPADYWRCLRDLRQLRFDATVVAFTGEPTYLKLKWIPFLLGIPHKLVFNRHYDCFFFSLRRLFTYRLGQHAEAFGVTRVLIVQTWDEEHTRRMLKRLREGEYFNKPRYYLFTRKDKAAAFADDTQLAQILTYPSDAGLLDYWKSLRDLRRLRFDAAVVAFTEEPSYSKLKWVPFLAGIPSKLVFNRHYDCFFFTAARFLRYWVQRYTGPVGSFRSSIPRLLWSLFLPLLRCFLFPLRFFYLVTAVTWRRLRRAYNSQQ